MKKRSVSSVLAERIRQRRAVTPVKHKVTLVKFTPEEMAYDPSPEETADWLPVGHGPSAIFAKPSKGSKTVVLEPDVAKVFKDADAANRALRKLIEAMPATPARKRKTA